MTTRLKNKLATVRPQVQEAYRNGATLRQIGDVHGVSPGTVRNVLIEMGETMRSRGRRKKSRTIDPRIISRALGDDTEEKETTPEEKLLSGYEGGNF